MYLHTEQLPNKHREQKPIFREYLLQQRWMLPNMFFKSTLSHAKDNPMAIMAWDFFPGALLFLSKPSACRACPVPSKQDPDDTHTTGREGVWGVNFQCHRRLSRCGQPFSAASSICGCQLTHLHRPSNEASRREEEGGGHCDQLSASFPQANHDQWSSRASYYTTRVCSIPAYPCFPW